MAAHANRGSLSHRVMVRIVPQSRYSRSQQGSNGGLDLAFYPARLVVLGLIVSLVVVASSSSDRGSRAYGQSDASSIRQGDEPPCPDVGGMVADVDPKRAKTEAGGGARFTLTVTDSACPERVHTVEVCIRRSQSFHGELRLSQRCASPPPFAGSSLPVGFRVRATNQAQGKYTIKFTVTEVFEFPNPPSAAAATRAKFRVLRQG